MTNQYATDTCATHHLIPSGNGQTGLQQAFQAVLYSTCYYLTPGDAENKKRDSLCK